MTPPHPPELRGRRVTVMGLGRHGGGVAAARWLAGQGARVTVTDLADESTLAESLAELSDAPIAAYQLAGHREADFRRAEIVVVNPAVAPGNHYVGAAREAGAKVTSEIELFLNACPARVVGVTGSAGKSTTASMLTSMLQRDGRRVWLGGNIGRSLLPVLEEMTSDDWAVLELSSFQLAWLSAGARWPEVAVVTNCAPNHLDWHGSFEHYRLAKQRLLREQSRAGVAVLNPKNREVRSWRSLRAAAWSSRETWLIFQACRRRACTIGKTPPVRWPPREPWDVPL